MDWLFHLIATTFLPHSMQYSLILQHGSASLSMYNSQRDHRDSALGPHYFSSRYTSPLCQCLCCPRNCTYGATISIPTLRDWVEEICRTISPFLLTLLSTSLVLSFVLFAHLLYMGKPSTSEHTLSSLPLY